MRKLTYGLVALAALSAVLMLTPLGVSAQQTIRNITILAMPADATELPAAAALGDDAANPTTTSVGAYLMCYDGSTWDRCPTSTGGAGAVDSNTSRVVIATDDPVNDFAVKGDANMVAHDAADAGNPLKVGAKAESALSGATMVADGDRTDLYAGLDGVLIVRPHANLEDLVQERTTNTDGASTAFASGLAAAGAGIKIYLTSCTFANSSASFATIDLRDGTAGSVLWTVPLPATGGAVESFGGTPLEFSTNTAVAFDVSAATSTVSISCKGFKSKL